MRLRDIPDYLALRRHLARPGEFLRSRRHPPEGPYQEVALRAGGALVIRNDALERHILHRIFARDEYRLGRGPRAPWDAVVDIGAHVGIFAARAAPLARRLIALEPDESNFELLEKNLARFPQASALWLAAAGRSGLRELRPGPNTAAHTLGPPGAPRGPGPTVLAQSVEDLFVAERIERCDLLKLDCEGAEYEVLLGIPAALWPRIDRTALEYHPLPGGDPAGGAERLRALLEAAGHSVRLVPSRRTPGRGRIFSSSLSSRRARGPG